MVFVVVVILHHAFLTLERLQNERTENAGKKIEDDDHGVFFVLFFLLVVVGTLLLFVTTLG